MGLKLALCAKNIRANLGKKIQPAKQYLCKIHYLQKHLQFTMTSFNTFLIKQHIAATIW